jgi:hypothetical protein
MIKGQRDFIWWFSVRQVVAKFVPRLLTTTYTLKRNIFMEQIAFRQKD